MKTIMKQIPWNKGKVGIYSEETKKKWSIARKGKKLSEEHKNKIREAMKGDRNPMRNIEARKKVSQSLRRITR